MKIDMYLVNQKQSHLYRPNVGCVIMKDGNIFSAKRVGYEIDAWQMPQGGVDKGEELEQAIFRELLEEIGTNNVEIVRESSYFRYYKIPHNITTQIWGGKYIGQKQKWFLLNFKGDDSEININTAKPEFESWKWSSPQDVVREAIFFKQDIYSDVLAEFELY